MNRTNRGKQFEQCIKESLENINGVSFDRLPDPMAGYSGVRNICDFSMFNSPNMFYLECKSLYDNTLNYKSDITENQWTGMTDKSKIYRCIAGVCVWFIDYDVTAFVNIIDLNKHRDSGAKSLNISDIVGEDSIRHFLIDGIKKRVLFSYFGESFLKNLNNEANYIWGNG